MITNNFEILEEKDIRYKFEEYEDFINRVCENAELSEKFMDDFSEILNWNLIVANQNLSKEFIEKHQKDVDWLFVSDNIETLPGIFAKEFSHNLSF